MKYAVDRIEENIVILENIETEEILEIDKSLFDEVNEKDIFTYNNGIFRKDLVEQKNREEIIREKMKKLKNI